MMKREHRNERAPQSACRCLATRHGCEQAISSRRCPGDSNAIHPGQQTGTSQGQPHAFPIGDIPLPSRVHASYDDREPGQVWVVKANHSRCIELPSTKRDLRQWPSSIALSFQEGSSLEECGKEKLLQR